MPQKKVATLSLPESQPKFDPQPPRSKRPLFLILIGLLVLALLWKNKSIFVAATVNGSPITRTELNKLLTSRYGSQSLDQLITQKLIETEIKKQNITVGSDQIDSKLDEFKKTLPEGTSLEQALKMQGVSLDEAKSQIKTMVALDQMFKPKIEISDSDIDKFIKENKSFITATTSGAQKEEARQSLTNQKFNELVNNWISDLKSKARITKYL